MIRFSVKKVWFNARSVMTAEQRATAKALSRFGAFVMTRARQSIKKAPKKKVMNVPGQVVKKKGKVEDQTAPEGSPPYSHKDGTLKRFIRFAVAGRSVVIGPEKLPGKIGDAPRSLEHSGPSQTIRGVKKVLKATRVRKHAFMRPAFKVELAKAPKLWTGAIKP